VKGIHLEIDDKELLTILGHNGAGKSTLIGVLTGILAPSKGTAKFKNFDINEDIEEIRQIIGFVP
jgi:ABC-2 type transport system ATP-binding protein